jgi:hypothetical protein
MSNLPMNAVVIMFWHCLAFIVRTPLNQHEQTISKISSILKAVERCLAAAIPLPHKAYLTESQFY